MEVDGRWRSLILTTHRGCRRDLCSWTPGRRSLGATEQEARSTCFFFPSPFPPFENAASIAPSRGAGSDPLSPLLWGGVCDLRWVVVSFVWSEGGDIAQTRHQRRRGGGEPTHSGRIPKARRRPGPAGGRDWGFLVRPVQVVLCVSGWNGASPRFRGPEVGGGVGVACASCEKSWAAGFETSCCMWQGVGFRENPLVSRLKLAAFFALLAGSVVCSQFTWDLEQRIRWTVWAAPLGRYDWSHELPPPVPAREWRYSNELGRAILVI